VTDVHTLSVSELTEEAFAPFGELLVAKEREPDLAIAGLEGWVADFHTDAATQLLYFSAAHVEPRFTTLERHMHVAQTVIPVKGTQLVAVAAPTDPTDADDIPPPEAVSAFLAEEGVGYVMKPGTWHPVGRVARSPPGVEFVMISDHATSAELMGDQAGWCRTQWVDYEERIGTVFEFDTTGL
jgi:ureidoglycolate hydrolase